MLNIIIADDHAIIRYGLKQIILKEFKEVEIYEAEDSTQLFQILKKHTADIVILDITMPKLDGIEILNELKKYYPKLPVLILSMHPEKRFAVRALKLGAAGYLTKDCAPDELGNAIHKILHGGKYITPTLGELLANSFEQLETRPAAESLSNREYQVFLLLASGKSVSECADQLAISVNTVSTYRTRILEKLNFKNNAEMIRYAIDNQLIE